MTIAWKDLIVLFRDRGALILMLGAPFVLTLGMGLVAGAFSADENSGGPTDIPIAVTNKDDGHLGDIIVQVFSGDELAGLLQLENVSSAAEARRMVAADELAAAILIPPGFSAALNAGAAPGPPAPLEIITNPGRPISAAIVRSITTNLLDDLQSSELALQISLEQIVVAGHLDGSDAQALAQKGRDISRSLASAVENEPLIGIKSSGAAEAQQPDLLAYLAPAFAVLFLTYTVTQGGRSILNEREKGTLARLMVNPLNAAQIMGGKSTGIFFSGMAQMSILILASSILFDLTWGGPLAVAVLLVTTVAAASGWGLLLASVAKNTHQVSSMGTAMMLTFGILGGSFFALPPGGFLGLLSKITPNAWAIEGFTSLAGGASLWDIRNVILALSVMAIVLFAVSAQIFRRRPLLGA